MFIRLKQKSFSFETTLINKQYVNIFINLTFGRLLLIINECYMNICKYK